MIFKTIISEIPKETKMEFLASEKTRWQALRFYYDCYNRARKSLYKLGYYKDFYEIKPLPKRNVYKKGCLEQRNHDLKRHELELSKTLFENNVNDFLWETKIKNFDFSHQEFSRFVGSVMIGSKISDLDYWNHVMTNLNCSTNLMTTQQGKDECAQYSQECQETLENWPKHF